MCHMNEDLENKNGLLLKHCALNECQVLCCYDGVYLCNGEDNLIHDVVNAFPDYFKHLPEDYIVYGEWRDGAKGLKTATTYFEYNIISFPKHFNKTRCVFVTEDYRCSLQIAAEHIGVHKWTFKPLACWLFPLTLNDGDIVPPPLPNEKDSSYIDESYPGYVSFVPCGKDNPEGNPWQEVLHEEIEYFHQAQHLPVWADRGLKLNEIIELAKLRK